MEEKKHLKQHSEADPGSSFDISTLPIPEQKKRKS